MTFHTIYATMLFLVASCLAGAAESVLVPAETSTPAARTVQMVIRGTLQAASGNTVRLEFAYTPGALRIRSARGGAAYALQDASLRIVDNTITDRKTGRFVIECANVQSLTDSVLCILDVDALPGPDTVGLLTPTALVVDGTTISGAVLQAGTVRITNGGLVPYTSQAIVENYPNPFRESTVFTYTISETTDVAFSIFDIYGRQYASYDPVSRTPGTYSFTFAPPSWEVACGTLVLEMKTSSGSVFHSFVRMK